MRRLKKAMPFLIANDGPLGPEWSDHPLKGEWAGYRERHVGGDFLLVYTVDDGGKTGQVIFVRAGTHAELLSE
jgi:mRNA interferase YafQ